MIKNEKLNQEELAHLKALITHEFAEADYLTTHPELMDRFLKKGDLTKDLIEYVTKARGRPPILDREPHPMTPYRYAHLVLQYTTSAQQPKSGILDDYIKQGLIKFNERNEDVLTAKGQEYMGLK